MKMISGNYKILHTFFLDDEIVAMYFSQNKIGYYSYKTKNSDSSLIGVVSDQNKDKCFNSLYKTSGIPLIGPNGDSYISYHNQYDSSDAVYLNTNTGDIVSSMPVQNHVEYTKKIRGF